MCRDVQDMVEMWRTRRDEAIEEERLTALRHGRSSTAADENDQRNETVDDDVPMGPPEPPLPPDEPAQRLNRPPSVELEGERRLVTSSENARTSNEADVLGASGCVEDIGNVQKKLGNVSEPVSKCSEPVEEKYLPRRARDDPHDPGGETAVPGGVHDVQEHPRNVNNECADETDALRRDRPPGGSFNLPEASNVAKGDSDHRKVVEGAEYDGVRLRSDENKHVVETNALRRGIGPGGHRGEQEVMGDVEDNWDRQDIVEGGGYDGI